MALVDIDEGSESREVVVQVEQLGLAAAEINQQIATAKAYPRSIERFRKEIIGQATLTAGIAQACVFALPRGGKVIEGPSIRLAEIVMAAWGNCRATTRIVAETDNFVVAQGIFFDLERNVAIGMEVNRRIIDSKGRRYDVDMIGVTSAAASSIALRNAIFRGIPRALYWDAYVAAKKTIMGETATLAQRRSAAIEAFKPYGVTEAQIFAALGVGGMVEVGLEQLVALGGFLTAIQQEERDPEEIFPRAGTKAERQAPPPAKENANGAKPPKQKVEGAAAGADGAKEGAPGPDASSSPAPPLEEPEPTELEVAVANMVADITNLAGANGIEGMFREEIDKAPPDVVARVQKQIADCRRKFGAQR